MIEIFAELRGINDVSVLLPQRVSFVEFWRNEEQNSRGRSRFRMEN